jgi:hypothetical protein
MLCIDTISRTITNGNLHVLNWMIHNGAPVDNLIEVCRTHGLEPISGSDPLMSEWMSCEPSIFAAVEAKRLDVLKWLVEERRVPTHPDICTFKNQSIFLFALSASSEEICDCTQCFTSSPETRSHAAVFVSRFTPQGCPCIGH